MNKEAFNTFINTLQEHSEELSKIAERIFGSEADNCSREAHSKNIDEFLEECISLVKRYADESTKAREGV